MSYFIYFLLIPVGYFMYLLSYPDVEMDEVSKRKPFSEMIGKQYVTVTDLYILGLRGNYPDSEVNKYSLRTYDTGRNRFNPWAKKLPKGARIKIEKVFYYSWLFGVAIHLQVIIPEYKNDFGDFPVSIVGGSGANEPADRARTFFYDNDSQKIELDSDHFKPLNIDN